MENQYKFPTEVIDLPSQGLLYSKESPLSSGTIEMKYMTAKEEDILTNQNYIQKGIVIDKLLQSLIVDKSINYSDILLGDKNALLLAARILGYGADYSFEYAGETHNVKLTDFDSKPLNKSLYESGKNEFTYTLPASETNITFKLLTHGDEQKIDQEVKGLQKLHKDSSPELSTRLKHMITSVDGDTNTSTIREFVDNRFLARDSRAFRKYVEQIQPDVDIKFYPEFGPEEGVNIPIGINFLWPDASI